MISGEGLKRGAPAVLGTLLHEAAHALATARGIKDTSRQGRYHNKHFRDLAEELGIATEHDQQLGWSITTIPAATLITWARQVYEINNALTLWRHDEHNATTTTRRSTNLIAAISPAAGPSGSPPPPSPTHPSSAGPVTATSPSRTPVDT
jgi:hypothetical protein